MILTRDTLLKRIIKISQMVTALWGEQKDFEKNIKKIIKRAYFGN